MSENTWTKINTLLLLGVLTLLALLLTQQRNNQNGRFILAGDSTEGFDTRTGQICIAMNPKLPQNYSGPPKCVDLSK